jgi:uncharacterized damage-inducible protein DinB
MRTLIAMLCLALATPAFGQGAAAPKPAEKLTVAQILDHQLSELEHEFVPAAEAMPDDKFSFAPTQGEFKGVRTFALEVKHVAHTNSVLFAMLLGEKMPPNVDPKEDNGPDKMTSKAEIIKYLKDSFAMGHRAMKAISPSTLTDRLKNPGGGESGMTRLAAATLTVWHSYDHYGQMVEYLRMNGIIPPASRPQ